MIRSEAIDEQVWTAIVDHVISDTHIEKALASHTAAEDAEAADPAATAARLESRLKQITRAEEVILERFGRGLITDSSLDKELLRLKGDRTAAERALVVAQQGLRRRGAAAENIQTIRKAISDLRGRLRIATAEDRRDLVRAIVARGENTVKIGPDRIDAQLLLAAGPPSAFAQAYVAG
jgi:hypothetical protein